MISDIDFPFADSILRFQLLIRILRFRLELVSQSRAECRFFARDLIMLGGLPLRMLVFSMEINVPIVTLAPPRGFATRGELGATSPPLFSNTELAGSTSVLRRHVPENGVRPS